MTKVFEYFKNKFQEYASESHGGCSTCNYGGYSVMSSYDYEELLRDIDKFIESLKEDK